MPISWSSTTLQFFILLCLQNQQQTEHGVIAGHNYIGTEHVLLGLLREGEGVAARVLETLGADAQKIRSSVRFRYLLTSLMSVIRLLNKSECLYPPSVSEITIKLPHIDQISQCISYYSASMYTLLMRNGKDDERDGGVCLKLLAISECRVSIKKLSQPFLSQCQLPTPTSYILLMPKDSGFVTRDILQVIRMVGESQEAVGVGAGTGPSSNKTPTLEEYGTNLTTQASEVRLLLGPSER